MSMKMTLLKDKCMDSWFSISSNILKQALPLNWGLDQHSHVLRRPMVSVLSKVILNSVYQIGARTPQDILDWFTLTNVFSFPTQGVQAPT